MHSMSRTGVLFSSLVLATSTAGAQTTGPGATTQPSTPDERIWYPTSDIYTPDRLVGIWFYVDNHVLHQLTQAPQGIKLKTGFINSRAYSYSRTKEDEASAKIPVFASVSLQDKQSQSLIIDDIATTTLVQDVGEPFCRDWPVLKNRRAWAVGDQLSYVVGTTLSHVAWKVGTEHTAGAEFGLGDYFSASGKQYDQTSVSAILPAVALQPIYKTITAVDLAGNPCPLKQKLDVQRPDRAKIVTQAVMSVQ